MMERHAAPSAKGHAKAQLSLFAGIALVPPLLVLELGAVLACLRRGLRVLTNGPRPDLEGTDDVNTKRNPRKPGRVGPGAGGADPLNAVAAHHIAFQS